MWNEKKNSQITKNLLFKTLTLKIINYRQFHYTDIKKN